MMSDGEAKRAAGFAALACQLRAIMIGVQHIGGVVDLLAHWYIAAEFALVDDLAQGEVGRGDGIIRSMEGGWMMVYMLWYVCAYVKVSLLQTVSLRLDSSL